MSAGGTDLAESPALEIPPRPRDAADPGSTTLAGRAAEALTLQAAIEEPSAVVLVEGEMGIGKSRLVAEVLTRLDSGIAALVGNCYQLAEPLSLGPLVEAVTRRLRAAPLSVAVNPLVGALRPLLPEVAEQLPDCPEALADRGAERHRVFRALMELLMAVSPAVLVIEDVHWIDDATLDFLSFLLSNDHEGLRIVATVRGEDIGDRSMLATILSRRASTVTKIQLGPLGPSEIEELVRNTLGAEEVSPDFIQHLSEWTGGVPLAVEEVLRLLLDRRDVIFENGRWARREIKDIEVPPSLRASIVERLRRLDEATFAVVQAQSVLAEPADELVIRTVASLTSEGFVAAITRANKAGMVEPDGAGFRFRHSLTKQAIYEDLSVVQRRALHARAAECLARHPRSTHSAGQIAWHLKEAGDIERWIHAAEAAADAAVAVYDDALATRLLEELLDEPTVGSTSRTRIALKLGEAALHAREHDRAPEVLQRFLKEEPLSAAVRGELRFSLGRLLLQTGAWREGLAELERSVGDLLPESPGLAARAMGNLALPEFPDGRIEDHLRWIERATEAATRVADPDVDIAVAMDRAVLLATVGDPSWREILSGVSISGTPESNRQWTRGHANIALATLYLGHYAEARKFADIALETSHRFGYGRLLDECTSVLLALHWYEGKFDEVEAGIASFSDDIDSQPSAYAAFVRGCFELVRGDPVAAEKRLEHALETSWSQWGLPLPQEASAVLARVRYDRGELDSALDIGLHALKAVSRKGLWAWASPVVPIVIDLLFECGEGGEANAILQEFDNGVRGKDAPAAAATLDHTRALALLRGGDVAGVDLLSKAAASWKAMPNPYQAARVNEDGGRLLLTKGEEEVAADLLFEALQVFDELGAPLDVARVKRTLRSAGIPLRHPWRGGRRNYGNDLSPREREVGRLAARGHTNREIAEILFLSPRTVGHHVAAVMRKLNVDSRRQLPEVELDWEHF